jgi:hypothetical protein
MQAGTLDARLQEDGLAPVAGAARPARHGDRDVSIDHGGLVVGGTRD